MKICKKCGIEIINGVNGSMIMGNICHDCGDRPVYYTRPRRAYEEGRNMTWDELDILEDKCVKDY